MRQYGVSDEEQDDGSKLQSTSRGHDYLVLCAAMYSARCLKERKIC
jgi:hypothetical protein